MEKQNMSTAVAISFLLMLVAGWFLRGFIDKPKMITKVECQQLKVIDDAIIDAWGLDDPVKASYILDDKGKERQELLKKLGY